jgi:tryptophan 7-halogenase
MDNRAIQSVAIIGGGLAGWMSAALLASVFGPALRLSLVETGTEGHSGHGLSTLPLLKSFFQRLDISETELLQKTQGSLKLGTQFVNWGSLGNRYFSPFGSFGADFDIVPLHHYWLKLQAEGATTASLEDYSMAWALAREGRFVPPSPDRRMIQSTFDYGYHLDPDLLMKLLKDFSKARGVACVQDTLSSVELCKTTGHVKSVHLAHGEPIEADFFLDCSGPRGLLLHEALGVERDDWSDVLPCNQITSLACARGGDFLTYTRITQRNAGWQGKVCLQDRTAHSHVYSDRFTTTDEAISMMMDNLDGPVLREPHTESVQAGKARKTLCGNVVALGAASGYLEPLEGTDVHLIQSSLYRLISYWPRMDFDADNETAFNALIAAEWESVRDLLVMHYRLTSRNDAPLWRWCQEMSAPESVALRMRLWRQMGRVAAARSGIEVFQPAAWIATLLGQGVVPAAWDPIADARTQAVQPMLRLTGLSQVIEQTVAQAPLYTDWLASHAPAPKRTH